MNTQVQLQNSLFRLAGRANSELVPSMRNTERMIRELHAIFTVQFNTQSRNTVLSKMPYLLFLSWRRTRWFEHYTACTSYRLWESQYLSRYVISCQSNLPSCVDKAKGNPAKPYRGLPQVYHGKSKSRNTLHTAESVNIFTMRACRGYFNCSKGENCALKIKTN